MPPLSLHLIYTKSEAGLLQDITGLERVWKRLAESSGITLQKPKRLDPREGYLPCDLQIHVEMPAYGAIPWSPVNWMWVNPTTWVAGYDDVLHGFDAFLFRDAEAAEAFRVRWPAWAEKVVVVPASSDSDSVPWVSLLQQAVEIRKARRPAKGIHHLPPLLDVADCPTISIVTPTFQRKRLMEIAFHNLLSTDYPRSKMEWIVVEDNDKSPHVMARRLSEFQASVPDLTIRYVTLEGRRSIGEKRNRGVEVASHDIVLCMDDDDHYPPTSFRRRVAWLTKGKVGGLSPRVAVCTTIALYDLKRGVSAVNVPPFHLPFAQRVSEATLTFYKSVWQERPFPEVSLSEGEGWLAGRTVEVLELPPQQIIVAFTHDGNQSSRRLPPSDQPPSCFWGFPKEYLVFVHGLVGVDVA